MTHHKNYVQIVSPPTQLINFLLQFPWVLQWYSQWDTANSSVRIVISCSMTKQLIMMSAIAIFTIYKQTCHKRIVC